MANAINEESAKRKDVVYFGQCNFRNTEKLFGIKRKDRRQHLYVIGKTGTGKSALLHNLIVQDITNGDGVCVVDPHGELVEGVLQKIPKSRAKDVIYFNPADMDYHIGFNPLELPDPKYKHLVASGLMGIFTKIWSNVWSARMEYILNNAILALLDTKDTTLLGIPRLLTDKQYRQRIINNLKDPVVKAFWVNEYEEWQDKFRNEAIAPIQNKVGQFLSTAMIRNVVGQTKSTIDIFEIMNSRKIFLVNVSKGRIGEDNSMLLGAMLITKIQLAAMERVRIREEERQDFYLYVDEFQNFATDSFASVLSEARKYRLNLIIAHQYIGQLVTDVSTRVRDAAFGNVGTMIVFRVGAADAEFLEPEFEPEFIIQDIVNLPNYHIYLKLMVNGMTTRPFSAKTLPPFILKEEAISVDDLIELSRNQYARPREEVEEEINSWSTGSSIQTEASSSEGALVRAGMPRESRFSSSGPSSGGGATGQQQYTVTCSACGKEARVPFRPMPGKPVYCSQCLEKVRTGEMAPVRVPRVASQSKNEQLRAEAGLADLGIEFEGFSGNRPVEKPVRPASPVGSAAMPRAGSTGAPIRPASAAPRSFLFDRPAMPQSQQQPPRAPEQPGRINPPPIRRGGASVLAGSVAAVRGGAPKNTISLSALNPQGKKEDLEEVLDAEAETLPSLSNEDLKIQEQDPKSRAKVDTLRQALEDALKKDSGKGEN